MNATESEVASEFKVEQRREEFLSWAKKYDVDEAWVDGMFTFHTDGWVTTEGNLDLGKSVTHKVTALPPGKLRIAGNFYAGTFEGQYFDLGSLRGKEIVGDCYVMFGRFGELPTSDELRIGGQLVIEDYDKELIDDAEKKGFRVLENFSTFPVQTESGDDDDFEE